MAFIYEGIDVDKPAAGFNGAPGEGVRASNIIAIANERIKYYTSIAESYNRAYKALADFKTANPNPRASGYSFATAGNLQLELDKWKAIVIRNGGKLKSAGSGGGFIGDVGQAQADFSAKITKYNQDISKYQQILSRITALQPAICVFPSPDQIMSSIVNDARQANAVAVAQAQAQASRENDYYNGIRNFNNPNRSATGDANWNPAGEANNVLNTGQSSGVLTWNVTTLGIAAATVPGGNLLGPKELAIVLRQVSPKDTIDKVKLLLMAAIKDVRSSSIPKPASTKNAALKPSNNVKTLTNPPKPAKVDPVSNNVKTLTNPGR
jgi:hypothetical protein